MKRTRRALLTVTGAAIAGSIAGCSGNSDSESPPLLGTEPNYRGWFDGVGNYEGTHDYRGEDSVTVRVGVAGGLGYYKYGPAAVAVTPGTTVRWEWTGQGGEHDVVALEGRFDSGDPVRSSSKTYTVTIEDPAIYRYFCTPHRDLGMRGAVFVALAD